MSDLYVYLKRNNFILSTDVVNIKAPVCPIIGDTMQILSGPVISAKCSANFLLKYHISKQGRKKRHVFRPGGQKDRSLG